MNDHKDFIRTIMDSVRYNFSELMTINLFWALLSIPIVTIPPALAGLSYATYQIIANQKVTKQTFFIGFKKYFAVSYVWFFSYVLVAGLLLFNIDLGIQQQNIGWIGALSGVYWVLLAAWIFFQVYSLPFFVQQEKPKVIMAIRNSVILWLKNPIFSVILTLVLLVIIIISTLLPPFWLLITTSLVTYIANLAVVFLLSREEAKTTNT